MSRTLQAIVGVILILVIAFSAIIVTQHIGKQVKVDVTEQKIFTLSDGTRAILGRLNQPIMAKLYYGKTAAMKGTDQIRFFNNYYEFVRALLEEYVSASNGMVSLELIDPRPYSSDEEAALRGGLKRFPITQEENFFFGLVIQTQFGVEKVIPFFSPDRQNFVEYDISDLIDTAITRAKKTLGVMSSLPVMGDSAYIRQMKMAQRQQAQPAWTIIEQLKNQYDVVEVSTDVNDISDVNNVDMLLVIHPKNLSEKTQFVLDQYVLGGGRMVLAIDTYCWVDRPPQQNPQQMMMSQADQASNIESLLRAWGLEMPFNTFAGDRRLALEASITQNQRAQKIIGYLGLVSECFNQDSVITGQLNDVKMLFPGVLRETATSDPNQPQDKLQRTPLIQTTSAGNSWKISGPYELMYLDGNNLMQKFVDGTTAVNMGYLLTGTFTSAFPRGISQQVQQPDPNDPNNTLTITTRVPGLTESKEDGAVIVLSDVDFMTDMMAYQTSVFGKLVVGDNSALLVNCIDDLGGSSDLISIRSRGNYRRPFLVVDQIEADAEKQTAADVADLQAKIDGYNQSLQSLVATAQQEGQADVIGDSIVNQRREIELQIRKAERQLNEVKLQRRESIESLGNRLRQINMLLAPAVILLIAIALGIHRAARKRHYISHESD